MTDDTKAPPLPSEAPEPVRTPTQIRGNSVVLDSIRKAKETEEEDFQSFTLKRDDNRPLRFKGNLVGYNEVDINQSPRGTQVQIFVTGSGKIVTAVYQWQRKEGLERERHKAEAHTDPEKALEWLIEDGGGKLGRSSREAWEMACNVEPTLAGHEVEMID